MIESKDIIIFVTSSLITLIVTWIFYVLSTKDLKKIKKEFGNNYDLLLRFLELKDHQVKINRNESGEPIGLIVNISAVSNSGTSSSATISDIKKDENN